MRMLWTIFVLASCAHLQKTKPSDLKPFDYSCKLKVSKEVAFSRNMLWIANTYKDINSVVSFKDEKLGAIRGHSRFCIYDGNIHLCATYHLDIDFKDGICHLGFHSLEGLPHPENGFYMPGLNVEYDSQYKLARKHFDSLAERWFIELGE